MRILEYRLDLFNRGYTVSGDTRHYEERRERECPPIKMTRFISGKPVMPMTDFIERIECSWDESKGTEEELQKYYGDILCRNSPEWRLISFSVSPECLYLDYYNAETNRTDWLSIAGDGLSTIQFEVPHADGKPCSEYEVFIRRSSNNCNPSAEVIEWLNGTRRELQFFRKDPNSDNMYVMVTEYADF